MHEVEGLKECETLIKSFGSKVLRRLRAAGCSTMQLEDILQELSVAWYLASKGFEPNDKVRFKTYLYSTMRQHINRWAENELRHTRATAFSLDDSFLADDEEKGSHDIVSANDVSADDIVLAKESRKRVLDKVSPRAQQFYQFLDNPPMELVQELRGLQSKAAWARSRGIRAIAPKSINSAVVFSLMDATRFERSAILKELSTAIQKVNR